MAAIRSSMAMTSIVHRRVPEGMTVSSGRGRDNEQHDRHRRIGTHEQRET
jgi:hypothetical protein